MYRFYPATVLVVCFFCFSTCGSRESVPDHVVFYPKGTFRMGSPSLPEEIQEKYGYPFTSNEQGVYHLLGNVWEWCSSPYVPQYPIEDNPSVPDEYVDREGGWDSPPFNARIYTRGAAYASFNAINLGFRVAMDDF